MNNEREYIDQLIVAYLAGELNKQQISELKLWIEKSVENEKYFMQYQEIWASSYSEKEMYQYDFEKAFERFKARISETEKKCTRPYFNILGNVYKYAAVVILAVGFLSVLYYSNHIHNDEYMRFMAVISELDEINVDTSNQVTIITDPVNKIRIDKGVTVAYSEKGQLSVDKKRIENESEKVNYNQLIVPKGKYSHLILSDGTEVYVNAGSKVVYPNKFIGKTREIYVDGEVALNVTKDKAHPFIVKTSDFNVRVLGTIFNVKSYKDMEKAEVVLAEGSVSVTDKNEEIIKLVPNEMLSLTEGKIYNKKTVDAEDFIAWTKGRLPMTGKSFDSIIHSLSLYYGCDITYDASVTEYSLYGTLDLHTSLEHVLERICKTIPIKVEKNKEGSYHLYTNINSKE